MDTGSSGDPRQEPVVDSAKQGGSKGTLREAMAARSPGLGLVDRDSRADGYWVLNGGRHRHLVGTRAGFGGRKYSGNYLLPVDAER